MTLEAQWADALSGISLRHPNPKARPLLSLSGAHSPVLVISISGHQDTRGKNNGAWGSFTISNVRLSYFPGTRLAQIWIAAAWAGYIQHEALEMVEVDGVNPLDPHQEPYETNPWNRGLRDGFPPVLTPDTLITALSVVMDRGAAEGLVYG